MSFRGDLPLVAVIGGTGKEGKGLAIRWSRAGYAVIVGSRSVERASAAASEIYLAAGASAEVSGATNEQAAARADLVVLTVPYEAHVPTLESLKAVMGGKLLIDVTVPLVPGKITRVHHPPDGSAAQEARAILGVDVEVAAAFHTISHEHLAGSEPIDCDVLVTGTSPEARTRALQLVSAAGLRGWDAGALENSSVTEGLTSVLIHINKKYGSDRAGIRITGAGQA